MKILKDLVEKMHDTLDEVEFYAEKAHLLKATHKELADTYAKIGEMHVDIYKHLHQRAVALIEEERKKGVAVPAPMMSIWEYEHGRIIKEFADAKVLLDEYNKGY